MHFLRVLSSRKARPGFTEQPPLLPKTSPMPAEQCFWRAENEGLLPSRPDLTCHFPEDLIEAAEAQARMLL
jgi:hypothetical protein